jgi:hypothetical protein
MLFCSVLLSRVNLYAENGAKCCIAESCNVECCRNKEVTLQRTIMLRIVRLMAIVLSVVLFSVVILSSSGKIQTLNLTIESRVFYHYATPVGQCWSREPLLKDKAQYSQPPCIN